MTAHDPYSGPGSSEWATPEPLRPNQRGFWSKVAVTDGCWLWRGRPGKNGYGKICLRVGLTMPAHRRAWEIVYGRIPAGLFVLHKCDVPLCVRPDHLFLGTQAVNIADKVAKGRQARGERHGRARLTAGDVLLMRRAFADGQTVQAIARHFKANSGTVSLVVRRKTWAWIP